MNYVRSIQVTNSQGDELTLHEFVERRFLTKRLQVKLDTGELVSQVDDQTFRIVATGEMLTRV